MSVDGKATPSLHSESVLLSSFGVRRSEPFWGAYCLETRSVRRARGLLAASRLLSTSLLLTFSAISVAHGASIQSRISEAARQADDQFLGRQNLGNVYRGLELVRQAVATNPQDYEAWWRISKFLCYLIRHTSEQEAERFYKEAIESGRRAVAIEPNRVEGHFWLGANLGLYAESHNVLEGLREINNIRREMEIVIRPDPEYEQASGLRRLARLYYEAPFFRGGDNLRSIELLEQALQRYPDSSLTLLYLADSLVGRRQAPGSSAATGADSQSLP